MFGYHLIIFFDFFIFCVALVACYSIKSVHSTAFLFIFENDMIDHNIISQTVFLMIILYWLFNNLPIICTRIQVFTYGNSSTISINLDLLFTDWILIVKLYSLFFRRMCWPLFFNLWCLFDFYHILLSWSFVLQLVSFVSECT